MLENGAVSPINRNKNFAHLHVVHRNIGTSMGIAVEGDEGVEEDVATVTDGEDVATVVDGEGEVVAEEEEVDEERGADIVEEVVAADDEEVEEEVVEEAKVDVEVNADEAGEGVTRVEVGADVEVNVGEVEEEVGRVEAKAVGEVTKVEVKADVEANVVEVVRAEAEADVEVENEVEVEGAIVGEAAVEVVNADTEEEVEVDAEVVRNVERGVGEVDADQSDVAVDAERAYAQLLLYCKSICMFTCILNFCLGGTGIKHNVITGYKYTFT